MCDRYVTKRLATLTPRELKAVMSEAVTQYVNRETKNDKEQDEHTDIVDFIENGLDMLAEGTYVVERSEFSEWCLAYSRETMRKTGFSK